MIDEGQSQTTLLQKRLERKLLPVHEAFQSWDRDQQLEALRLKRELHVGYLHRHFGVLPDAYTALDASQPWMVYWNVHSLALLGASLPGDVRSEGIVEFLRSCRAREGGYGGGPRQLGHLAPTYAAVMSLMTIGTMEAYRSIDREKIQEFLLSRCVPKEEGGGMTVHEDGEADVRSCYCAIAVAHVLNLDKHLIAERSDMIDFIRRCQTFEGGLGGEPGNEAHGGYTFCGLAALCLLNRTDVLNLAALLQWSARMQGPFEGGFIGRTHKLVDGCYSYWQGAVFLLLESCTATPALWSDLVPPDLEIATDWDDLPMFENVEGPASPYEAAKDVAQQHLRRRAQELHLDLKQALSELPIDASSIPFDRRLRMDLFRSTFDKCQGTLRSTQASFSASFSTIPEDRPYLVTKKPNSDVMYDTIGLQFWVLLHCQTEDGGLRDKPNKEADLYHTCYCLSGLAAAQQYGGAILGPKENALQVIDPVLNIVASKARSAIDHYRSLDATDQDPM